MSEATPDYLKPPKEVDMDAEERAIRLFTSVALILSVGGYVAAYHLLSAVWTFPTALDERLAFAAVGSAFVLIWVLVAVAMVSTARRHSPQDIGGSAAGPPSHTLAIKSAFLQNTLEQAVIAVGFFGALAALAGGPWLALIPVAVVYFAVGRVLFYRGYPRGAKGRAFGMGLTMTPAMVGYVIVIGLSVTRLF